MKLCFLGTSAGMPTLQRNVTSLALNRQGQKTWDLIDCGEATQHQIMRSPLSPSKVNRIFITHLHGDHIYGLPGILTSRSFQSSHPITIYGPVGIKKFIKTVLEVSLSRIHYEINFYEFSISGKIYEDDDETISTIALDHDAPSFAYVFDQKDKLGSFLIDKAKKDNLPEGRLFQQLKQGLTITLEDGRIINGRDYLGEPKIGVKIIVGGDNCQPSLLEKELIGTDVFIHEATHTRESVAKITYENKHSCAYQVAESAEKCKVSNLILTHFSSRFNKKRVKNNYCIDDIYQEALQHYTGNLFLAEDLQVYSLEKDNKITAVIK